MKILRLIMALVGLLFLGAALYHLFIDSEFFSSLIFMILGVLLFLFRGFEMVTDRKARR
ncbi:hypothetical protein ACQUWN_11545 [Rossellomorea aquimaris]|uniref:hypothetical protein n=1 Tax=Rossellomorea TaxID=2837508 RepID=UPI00165398EA|nr:hypothetical protein [Rossellomorea vietnamensis]